MKCPKCQSEVQEGWKVCPACRNKLPEEGKCLSCGKELKAGWKACPFCGVGTQESSSTATTIKDSVVKELHQTQSTDAKVAEGASFGGGIHFVIGDREKESGPARSGEVIYEEYVLAILHAGGSLEKARARLDEIRCKFGLTLRVTKEIEHACSNLQPATFSEDALQSLQVEDRLSQNAGKPIDKDRPCPKCGATTNEDWEACPECGQSLVSRCVSCGQFTDPGRDYCTSCGKPVSEKVLYEDLCSTLSRINHNMKSQLEKYRAGRKALNKIERSHGNIDERLPTRERADLLDKLYDDLYDALGKIVEADAVGDSWVGDKAKECWNMMTSSMFSRSKANIHLRFQLQGKQKALSNLRNGLQISEKYIALAPQWMIEAYEEIIFWTKDEIERLNSLNY